MRFLVQASLRLKRGAFLQSTVIFILLVLTFSCNKKNSAPTNNNEVKASAILLSGATVIINAKERKATMGCNPLGGGTYVVGTDESNALVGISVLACVKTLGNHSGFYICQYTPNSTLPTSPNYSASGPNAGSITFTSLNEKYMEGFFSVVCYRTATDSVIVSGTFKGDQLN